MKHIEFNKIILAAGMAAIISTASAADAPAAPEKTSAPAVRELTVSQCLDEALLNNHRRPASKFAVAMAEAQHRQVLSGYWPQVGATAGYQRMDEAPDFIFPASELQVPAGSAVITVPAGILGRTRCRCR